MLVYVINLQRHIERRRHLGSRLAEVGLSAQWIDAVDGRAIAADDLNRRATCSSAGSYPLTPTQHGCYLSHIKAWQTFLETEAPLAAIFEDDIHFSDELSTLLNTANQWIPSDADIIKLETCLKPVRLSSHPVSTIRDHALFRLNARHLGAAAYIVSRQGARKLLDNSEELTMGVDAAMFNPRPLQKHSLVNYQIDPAPCIQDDIAYRCGLPQLGFSSANPVSKCKKSYGNNPVECSFFFLRDSLRRLRLRLVHLAGGSRKRIVDFG